MVINGSVDLWPLWPWPLTLAAFDPIPLTWPITLHCRRQPNSLLLQHLAVAPIHIHVRWQHASPEIKPIRPLLGGVGARSTSCGSVWLPVAQLALGAPTTIWGSIPCVAEVHAGTRDCYSMLAHVYATLVTFDQCIELKWVLLVLSLQLFNESRCHVQLSMFFKKPSSSPVRQYYSCLLTSRLNEKDLRRYTYTCREYLGDINTYMNRGYLGDTCTCTYKGVRGFIKHTHTEGTVASYTCMIIQRV